MTKIEIEYKSCKELFGFDLPLKLPVFKEKSQFVPQIDPNYVFDEEITGAILAGFCHNLKVMIQGFHGTGKSTHIEQVAARLNWPVFRLNLDGYITRIELIGKDGIELEDGKQITKFQPGILPWAASQPMALVLDEYDSARPDVMFVLQRLLEAGGKLALPEQNQLITPHEHFRLFATANTVGQGDVTGLYHGVQYINQGQMDRWNILAKLDFLKSEAEYKIVAGNVSELKDVNLIKAMIQLATLTREAFEAGEISVLMSPRTVINWAQNLIVFGDKERAFRYSFLNKAIDSERPIIAEFYQRVFGEELAETGVQKLVANQ